LANELKLQRVEFSGPLYGEDKWRAYQEADLYVLPSHSENFGMTVAEALAAGTPVITTRGAPWAELEPRGVGWWIDIGVDALVASLQEAMTSSPEELIVRGERGREWMIQKFSWQRVGTMMDQTYQWLLHRGEMPNWVHLE
ncbi:MAG: glycosyltransferase, partial [Alphaproteobacteria bacterium]|nr:glycosyltransferase [Alphaproteobacteria bacterium]